MEWLSENWILVVLLGGMAIMHLKGGGCCGGGHKHGKSGSEKKSTNIENNKDN